MLDPSVHALDNVVCCSTDEPQLSQRDTTSSLTDEVSSLTGDSLTQEISGVTGRDITKDVSLDDLLTDLPSLSRRDVADELSVDSLTKEVSSLTGRGATDDISKESLTEELADITGRDLLDSLGGDSSLASVEDELSSVTGRDILSDLDLDSLTGETSDLDSLTQRDVTSGLGLDTVTDELNELSSSSLGAREITDVDSTISELTKEVSTRKPSIHDGVLMVRSLTFPSAALTRLTCLSLMLSRMLRMPHHPRSDSSATMTMCLPVLATVLAMAKIRDSGNIAVVLMILQAKATGVRYLMVHLCDR